MKTSLHSNYLTSGYQTGGYLISWQERAYFLAHWKRISDILSWDRKSYLSYVILPMLSHEGYTLIVLELKRMVVK